jgi:hypothetical protein
MCSNRDAILEIQYQQTSDLDITIASSQQLTASLPPPAVFSMAWRKLTGQRATRGACYWRARSPLKTAKTRDPEQPINTRSVAFIDNQSISP